MKTWECPKCPAQITCLGSVDGHFCPNNKSKWCGPWILAEDKRAKEAKTSAD